MQNVWIFKYLGVWFSADGDHLTDVIAKVVRATTTAGKMPNIWVSRNIPLQIVFISAGGAIYYQWSKKSSKKTRGFVPHS